jgi:hypothetical protein
MGFFDFRRPSSVANFLNKNITNAVYMACPTMLINKNPTENGDFAGGRMVIITPKISRMSHAFFMIRSKWFIESPIISKN